MLDPVFFALGSPDASTCRSSQTAAYLRRGREFRRSSERDAVRVHDCASVDSADSTGFDNASDYADHSFSSAGVCNRARGYLQPMFWADLRAVGNHIAQ